ncbi:hypothetical protein [Sulfolobus polyhedral virus 3]|nr:hypothetical protein [Sulfolobus polyhedral virus 3]
MNGPHTLLSPFGTICAISSRMLSTSRSCSCTTSTMLITVLT